MSAHVVLTAGHVDHGKSTLVRAVTGTDPDRLAEEKARGLTIDLGFAFTTLPSGRTVAFVDVPGHVRLVKNMLAGAGAVDTCLFVVAATEGWKPQSEEHLRILELLGHRGGVVALTKVAGLEETDLELAHLELDEHLAGTFLEGREVVEVDVPAGIGLVELTAALERLLDSAADRSAPGEGPEARPTASGRPRLWIDRSFAISGSGTVVTGTLAGGCIAVGDRLEVVPGPGPDHRPLEVRVRALQSHGREETLAEPGRVAANLSGVDHHQVTRGQALVARRQWEPTATLDASLAVLASLDHDVSRRGAYRVYVGSGQHAARIRLLGADAVVPGGLGLVRVHLPVPLPLTPGDRYVLREMGRHETVGGGEVLDVAPVLPASRARPDRSVERVVAERGVVEADLLERLTGVHREPDLAGRFVTDGDARRSREGQLRESIAGSAPLGLELSRLGEVDRALVSEMDGVLIRDGVAHLHRPAGGADPLVSHPFLAALEASPYKPPSPEELAVDRRELRELVRRGSVVESGGCYFAPSAFDTAASVIARMLAEQPAGVTASSIRERLGTSRKYLLPLLAHLDATGVTRRRGDLRIGGPRLPA